MSGMINGKQAEVLRDLFGNYTDGEDVAFTFQEDGALVVGFTLATLVIDPDGEYEEV